MNRFLSIIIVGLLTLVFCGCSTPTYDVLPPLPEYPESDSEFDTSAFIEFQEDSDAGFNREVFSLLHKYGYGKVLPEMRAFAHDLSRTRVLTLLHVQRNKYNCEDGSYLETRVIMMVRQPGEVWNGILRYKNPRYFQAFSRHKLAENGNMSAEDLAQSFSGALANIFRIPEFRQALEPLNKENAGEDRIIAAEDHWRRSISFQSQGLFSDAVYQSYLAAADGHARAEKYLLSQAMYSPVLRGDELLLIVRKKAESGDAAAQNKFGLMYLNGEVVPENNSKAFYWFSKAAEQQFAFGQLNVGHCYEHGYGVARNIPMAVFWYKKAAQNGASSAALRLKRLTGK